MLNKNDDVHDDDEKKIIKVQFLNNVRKKVEIMEINNSYERIKTEELKVGKEYIVYSVSMLPETTHGVAYLADFGTVNYFLPKGVGINIFENFESIKNWKATFLYFGMKGKKKIVRFFPNNKKKNIFNYKKKIFKYVKGDWLVVVIHIKIKLIINKNI